MKTCYYELLKVERTATDAELKRAYRVAALQWHPDKNPDRIEEATRQFRLIQEAYDVLSDPQERAFYDRNRESVIRGAGQDFDEGQIVDVMAYFTTSVFNGFGDDPGGFYSVYRNLFAELGGQENSYADIGAPTESLSAPTFGSSQASSDTLKAFYGFWTSFSTRMSFAWCDDYETRRAQNRRVRRLMEKENKRSRETAKREYSDNVRALAKFVQKRDPRWKTLQEEIKAANEMRAVIEARKRAEEKAERLQQAMLFQEQDWMKVSDEALEASMEGRFLGDPRPGNSSEEEEVESDNDLINDKEDIETEENVDIVEEYFCVACDKSFKSDQQFQSHERSKKHIKNVKNLLRHMKSEEEQFSGNAEPQVNLENRSDIGDDNDHELAPSTRSRKSRKKKSRQSNPTFIYDDDNEESISAAFQTVEIRSPSPDSASTTPATDEPLPNPSKQKKKKKQPNKTNTPIDPELICNVCKSSFSSRNKLFQHITESGHAQAQSSTGSKANKKKR